MSGIIGVYSTKGDNVADLTYASLVSLQERGQAAAGIAIAKDSIIPYKRRGGVREVIEPLFPFLLESSPFASIGHSLYEMDAPSQPIEPHTTGKRNISFAMDGYIPGRNVRELADRFSKCFENGDFYQGADRFMSRYSGRGAYCITALIEEDEEISLVVLRDPKGIKPLCLGRKDDTYVVASETCALDENYVEFVRDVEPGELIVMTKDGLHSEIIKNEKHAHCMFEWIYFGNIRSSIEGIPVAEVREKLGKMLAQKYPLDVDIVGASPDSGRGVAQGFADELNVIKGRYIPYREAIIKKAGSPKTFQIEMEKARELAARHKFGIVAHYTEGKRIAVGEDSIVRGTVSKSGYVTLLRKLGGVKEVDIIVSCPPLVSPCFKKFDDSRIAAGLHGKPIEETNKIVADRIGADSVCYSTLDIAREAIGLEDLCMGCLTTEYPIKKEFLPKGSGYSSTCDF